MAHDKQVEIRWSDVDAYMHVNNAVYATYLEECRDEWVDGALGDVGESWDFVLAQSDARVADALERARDDDFLVLETKLTPEVDRHPRENEVP